MQQEAKRSMEVSTELAEYIVGLLHEDRISEIATEQNRADDRPANNNRRNREQYQRQRYNPGRFMQVPAGIVINSFLAMKYEEEQSE